MSEPEEDFATLFEASTKTTRLETGRAVEGRIVAIGADVAFIDVGGKGEATLALDELRNDDGVVEAKVGDRIQATVTSIAGGVTLSRKLQRGAATARQLESAFHSRLPVEGKVEREVKGGLEVSIAKQRAFCPASQIDIVRQTDLTGHLGRVYTFRIIEYGEGGRKFVVSRRSLLEEEQQARAAEVRRAILPGAIVTGRVASVRNFGAFIELGGGVQGLLHVSEMGWSRVEAAAAVAQGQELTLKVLRVDDASGQIALSLKQILVDPWQAVTTNYAVGQTRQGRVTRVAEFGAFVELEPGIEALAHVSTFAPSGAPGGWRKSIGIGTDVTVEVLTIEPDKRRIGVALVVAGSPREAAKAEADAMRDYAQRQSDQSSSSLGSLADKLRGALGRKD